jgi:hypothetical protein
MLTDQVFRRETRFDEEVAGTGPFHGWGATVATGAVVCDNRRSTFADSLVIRIRVIS